MCLSEIQVRSQEPGRGPNTPIWPLLFPLPVRGSCWPEEMAQVSDIHLPSPAHLATSCTFPGVSEEQAVTETSRPPERVTPPGLTQHSHH